MKIELRLDISETSLTNHKLVVKELKEWLLRVSMDRDDRFTPDVKNPADMPSVLPVNLGNLDFISSIHDLHRALYPLGVTFFIRVLSVN